MRLYSKTTDIDPGNGIVWIGAGARRRGYPDRVMSVDPRRIVVVGSSNTDMIIRAERIPRVGQTVLGGEFLMAGGGKGANQAVGAARAGGNVAIVARVGRDVFGEQAIAGLANERIDVSHIYRDGKARSGVALIVADKAGQNSIAVASGVNRCLSPGDVRKARRLLAGASVLLMQLESPLETVQAAALLAKQTGVRVILNPAPACTLPDRLLHNISILTPNQTEAEMLTGIKLRTDRAAGRAASALRARGVPTVIVTLGERGAYLACDSSTGIVPGFKVKAVDSTGAGDIFNGTLAVALAEGRPLLQAVRFANAVAAISVTRLGAQRSAPRRAAIERLLELRM
jgi:ribokinase